MKKVQDNEIVNDVLVDEKDNKRSNPSSEIRVPSVPREIKNFINRRSYEQYGRPNKSSFVRQVLLMIYEDYQNGIAYGGMLGTILGTPPDPRPTEFKPYVKRVENGESGELYNRMMDSVAKEIDKLGS